ncbi:MAG: hypothetical protein GWN51_04180, partial [Gemmatimonadetes bacterium]|nr:hypothetical protein [Gemmatimonadota bacterium]NIW74722.1 hypothetical protein [Gemmatimonadota bacterium]
ERYKQLCDQPNVFSRWMLHQTIELAGETPVADALAGVLGSPPLEKPDDHRGGPATDMFVLELEAGTRRAVVDLVARARESGAATEATSDRGLGGFVEAWREYLDWNRG